MALKHAFTSGKSDGADGTQVQPSNWNADHVIDVDGATLAARTDLTDASAPAADKAVLYAKELAGSGSAAFPMWRAAVGGPIPLERDGAFCNNRIVTVGGNGTSVGAIPGIATPSCDVYGGTSLTTAGTHTQPALATTNLKTQTRRVALSTGTSAGGLAYIRGNILEVWRGNAAGFGGFFFSCRFGLNTMVSGNRCFIGLNDTAANPTNTDPLASTTPGKFGVGFNANTGNWFRCTNVTGSAPTTADLGGNFPLDTTSLLELVMYAKPNDSTIYASLRNLSTGNVTSWTWTTNYPSSTTFLTPWFWITNNATASAAIIEFVRMCLETDY